jgi:hypothetical protein
MKNKTINIASMNREIKFRMWRDGRMQGVHTMYSKVSEPPCEPQNFAFSEEEVLMQFTGLKDKNGKEIYEGDIVRCTRGCLHIVEWYGDNGGMFLGGMPGFNLSGLQRNGGKGYAWTGDEEIFGNIYENPNQPTL